MTPAFRDLSGPLPPLYDAARAARVLKDLDAEVIPALKQEHFRALLAATAGNSPYLARLMLRESAFLEEIYNSDPAELLAALNREAISVAEDEDAVAAIRRLRVAKRRVALTIALADVAGVFDLDAVTGSLSRFADASVKGALRHLLRAAAKKAEMSGVTPEELEQTTGIIVLAMGKHGGFELNYSSDIDIVVFYEDDRFPFDIGGEKRRAAVELVKGLVKLLSDTTSDGYVFRVDLRLRPDAGATQVAISAQAAEEYYELMGQNWERAAMIKARACAGDPEAAARLLKNLAPFVWRKNLDYAAIQDIHSIKRQIHAHRGHEHVAILGHNLKLGRGGIREIEFFAQTQQLILGGRDLSLRGSRTVETLAALRARGLISAEAERELAAAYRFLRMLEHRLQMIEDQQTHELPKTREGLDHVARFSGYADTEVFEMDLLDHLRKVEANYARLFEQEAPLAGEGGSLVFTGVDDDPETIKTLAAMRFHSPSDVAAIIRGWHHGRIRATRSARARELLTKLIPALLTALGKTVDPQTAFMNFDRFLTGLPSGVQVFSLLLANTSLLDLIADIAGSAPRLADYLGRNPAVLDALIDAGFMTSIPDHAGLSEKFTAERARVPGFEPALDAARRFAREELFRIGVQIIRGQADPESAGPAYAAVAETVIAGLHPVVEEEMIATHGRMPGGAFAIAALGKLGSREMTAGSDLDLVFVYTNASDAEQSDGRRPLSPSQYFARASQRFVAALTAMTAEGRLYDVDMRLRPSGNQGPVAVRLKSFADYHATQSWTWEKMALTRARVLCGPPELRSEVESVITQTLIAPVDTEKVLRDAREMREKIALQFPGKDRWDLKFAPGGLVDIEFVAQALQLCFAAKADVLDQNTIAALEKLARVGALSKDDAATLIAAARFEHALTQVLRIALDGAFQPDAASEGLKALLVRAARAVDFPELEAHLAATQAQVRAVFNRIVLQAD
jgi:glutamate-ammonia-ligase adenylyltransferase